MKDTPPVGDKVLSFYKDFPFNSSKDISALAQAVQSEEQISDLAPLERYITPGMRVLEAGCGVGWMSAHLAHRGAKITGVDFNPTAIGMAKELCRQVGVSVDLIVANIDTMPVGEPYDAIVSIGVLHHTADCLGNLKRLCAQFLVPGGYLYVGLYHAHGRRPFLEHFASLKQAGASEDELLAEFKNLAKAYVDDDHLYSWFRDQVLHPHETQHTVEEIWDLLSSNGMEMIGTSLNNFGPLPDRATLAQQERTLGLVSRGKLRRKEYYPGFFYVLARRA